MNKSLDERLVPNGEYIDALNVRVGSTELSEIGSVENTKGNERLTTLLFDNEGLSSSAKCIGAYEDGAEENIYWFITDPAHTGGQATGKLDMIVSYNTNSTALTYHVISVDDGGGVNTTLNFNSQYLITGVDKVDNLLFFTDDLNQPRVIDVDRNYPDPSPSFIDGGGSPDIFGESLLVIKKPPINSPSFELTNRGSEQNFIEDRFICFAYRYRYANDQYSATSQFSDPAFIPKAFDFDNSSYLNEGMENAFDTVVVTFNTGSELVVGIDLLFKEASNPVIRVIEKLDKVELGYADDQDVQYEFSNNKIYTVLDDAEILRLYDNVPIKAKAQTIMGSRLVYGNYVDGFDLVDSNGADVRLGYEVEYTTENVGETQISPVFNDGSYSIGPAFVQPESIFSFDLSGVDLKAGGRLDFSIRFQHGGSNGLVPTGVTETATREIIFSYTLKKDFADAYELSTDSDFNEKIGTDTNIQPIADACDGLTLTDLFNCSIPNQQTAPNSFFTKVASGETADGQSVKIKSSTSSTSIGLQLPATVYVPNASAPLVDRFFEYYEITFGNVVYRNISSSDSLHSNRDYDVGIIYMDEFNRSTTVLVSSENSVHIPCENSKTQNKLQVTIPTTQRPPAFATRYKFAIKQDKDLYETIYSNIYYFNPNDGYTYFLLEGENTQKVTQGDTLIVKADGNGPKDSCIFVTVLEKEAKERGFIEITDILTNQDIEAQAGVYMKVRNSDLIIDSNNSPYRDLQVQKKFGTIPKPFAVLDYGGFNYVTSGVPYSKIPIDGSIPQGTKIKMKLEFRSEIDVFNFKLAYLLEQEFISSSDYSNIKNWWDGDFIYNELDQGVETIENGSITLFTPIFGITQGFSPGFFKDNIIYDSNLSTDLATAIPNEQSETNQDFYFIWYQDTNGYYYLVVRANIPKSAGQTERPYLEIRFEIIKPGDLVIFETETQDAAPDIWYESSVSYPITNGFHEGNVQNQTAALPAIIDTEFQNCFTFGNGAESFKIRDSITRKTFGLGNRVSSVLKGEEFKEVDRFSDLTYSGVYSFNVNNLNEFNLGILNFKPLEPSFGLIQKLFARETDILVLQEDKVSYVLAGKNLLSDSAAGGAVTSVPEVLGTQIARIEEYGISNNPESFAQYGYDKYFTDSKRGVLLQLKGASYNNDQLVVVSNFGMSSWFRDLFLEDGNTQKLGGYDPFMKEYVLSSNETLLPVEEEPISCGVKKTFTISATNTVNYTVDLGEYVGDCSLTYNVVSNTGGITLQTTYNGVVQQDIIVTATPGTGTPINKNLVNVQTADIQLSMPGGEATIELTVGCPDADQVTIIQVCISDDNDKNKTIHNQYRWTSGTFVSPLKSQLVTLASGTTSPLVSQYTSVTGLEGGGVIPVDGASVDIISRKFQSDSFDYDTTLNNFAYLRTNTLYNNNPTDIASLLAAATVLPPPPISGATGEYYETFTMPSGSDQYLYLIYDYRKPTAVTLCYSNISSADACCGC
jgi:hypothetical protein